MPDPGSIEDILGTFSRIAEEPHAYAADWKQRTSRKVVGIFPMNFPLELVHAAGALPVVVQESRTSITEGRSLLFEFYCGYSRSIVDQAATGELAVYDGFFLVDHCVALVGAADALRFQLPETRTYLAQYMASMDEDTTRTDIVRCVRDLRDQLEALCGTAITPDALARSIALFNTNRRLQRQVYDLRRTGRTALTARQVQAIVKSSMVMDIEEHTALLQALVPALDRELPNMPAMARLHLSGHFCHAPQPELFDMIESCGAIVVDDDLYTGFRFISTDVKEDFDPVEALVDWYFARNNTVPCATRAQKSVDWETYLSTSLEQSGADGVIVLMAKFCEPHMLYYPELRKEFARRNTPFLLIETEHEGLALEMLRTRVEALVEGIRRKPAVNEPGLAQATRV